MIALKRVFPGKKLLMLPACILLSPLFCWGQAGDGNLKPSAGTAAPLELASAPKNAAASILASRAKPRDDSFVIGADDVLAVNVFKEAEVSRTVTVRSDGKISLPLVGELQASAKTPKQLEDEISSELSAFIPDPAVTVIVQEIRSQHFNILGRVLHPGSYPLTNSATVLDAIALGGGFVDFAKQTSIYILRANSDGTQTRIPFNYKDVIKGKHPEQNVKLESHDTVVVP
jgi:polysaccharide export outer membrane protein